LAVAGDGEELSLALFNAVREKYCRLVVSRDHVQYSLEPVPLLDWSADKSVMQITGASGNVATHTVVKVNWAKKEVQFLTRKNILQLFVMLYKTLKPREFAKDGNEAAEIRLEFVTGAPLLPCCRFVGQGGTGEQSICSQCCARGR